jgi:hypothetical protein
MENCEVRAMKKAALLAVWVIALGLLVYSLFYTENWVFNGTVILGWLLFAIQLTMSHHEKAYLWVRSKWFQLMNPECLWNMTVVFNGSYDRTALDQVENALKGSRNLQPNKIETLSNLRKSYSIKSLRFEVAVDEQEGATYFSIHDMEVSFRRSRQLIETELAQLFEAMQMVLKPDSGQYGLNIEFKGYNPYFGFFVRRLNVEDIQRFHITFKVESDRVAVTKNSIEINTDSLQHLRILTTRYLTLSPAK